MPREISPPADRLLEERSACTNESDSQSSGKLLKKSKKHSKQSETLDAEGNRTKPKKHKRSHDKVIKSSVKPSEENRLKSTTSTSAADTQPIMSEQPMASVDEPLKKKKKHSKEDSKQKKVSVEKQKPSLKTSSSHTRKNVPVPVEQIPQQPRIHVVSPVTEPHNDSVTEDTGMVPVSPEVEGQYRSHSSDAYRSPSHSSRSHRSSPVSRSSHSRSPTSETNRHKSYNDRHEQPSKLPVQKPDRTHTRVHNFSQPHRTFVAYRPPSRGRDSSPEDRYGQPYTSRRWPSRSPPSGKRMPYVSSSHSRDYRHRERIAYEDRSHGYKRHINSRRSRSRSRETHAPHGRREYGENAGNSREESSRSYKRRSPANRSGRDSDEHWKRDSQSREYHKPTRDEICREPKRARDDERTVKSIPKSVQSRSFDRHDSSQVVHSSRGNFRRNSKSQSPTSSRRGHLERSRVTASTAPNRADRASHGKSSASPRKRSDSDERDRKSKPSSLVSAVFVLLEKVNGEDVSDTELSELLPTALWKQDTNKTAVDKLNDAAADLTGMQQQSTSTGPYSSTEADDVYPDNLTKLSAQIQQRMSEPEPWDSPELSAPSDDEWEDPGPTTSATQTSLLSMAAMRKSSAYRPQKVLAVMSADWQSLIQNADKSVDLGPDQASRIRPALSLSDVYAPVYSVEKLVPIQHRASGTLAIRFTGISRRYLGEDLFEALKNELSNQTDSQSPITSLPPTDIAWKQRYPVSSFINQFLDQFASAGHASALSASADRILRQQLMGVVG